MPYESLTRVTFIQLRYGYGVCAVQQQDTMEEERSEVYASLEAAPIFGLGYSHPPPPGPKANANPPNPRTRRWRNASHVRHERINSFSQDNTPDRTLILTTPFYSDTPNNPPQTSAMAT
jgi:hypothetical protein